MPATATPDVQTAIADELPARQPGEATWQAIVRLNGKTVGQPLIFNALGREGAERTANDLIATRFPGGEIESLAQAARTRQAKPDPKVKAAPRKRGKGATGTTPKPQGKASDKAKAAVATARAKRDAKPKAETRKVNTLTKAQVKALGGTAINDDKGDWYAMVPFDASLHGGGFSAEGKCVSSACKHAPAVTSLVHCRKGESQAFGFRAHCLDHAIRYSEAYGMPLPKGAIADAAKQRKAETATK